MKYGQQAKKGAEFLAAYEVLGDSKYLDAARNTAEFILKGQQPEGYWLRGYYVSPEGVVKNEYNGRPLKDSREEAPPGGYGLLSKTQGWDWRNRILKVEDWFALPLSK